LRLTRADLPCLLTNQTALTPPANLPSKAWSSPFPPSLEEPLASQADRSAASPADPRLAMAADVSAQTQSRFSIVRPQNNADSIANAAKAHSVRCLSSALPEKPGV
jgi:hypothetical protein